MMQYNKNKHLKLLKSAQKSENPRKPLLDRKHLSDEEFSKFLDSKPDENFFELQAYSVMMICHLHWENREHYFELIEKLLNGNGPINLINFLPLREKHRAIIDAVEMLEAELILLEPNPKCEGFDELIEDIVLLSDANVRESYELSEEKLRKLIENIFIQMKDRYP